MSETEYVPPIARQPRRQRTISNNPPKEFPVVQGAGLVQRRNALCFPDGDVAITAPLSSGRSWYFRVHQRVFIPHSKCLRHIFETTPHSICTDSDMVTLPWIKFAESAVDVENFIYVMYGMGNDLALETRGRDVAGILDLAIRYGVTALVSQLRVIYTSLWPKTLDEWDVEEDFFDMVVAEYFRDSKPCNGHYAEDFCLQEPASAIRLAWKCGIPKILPAALYHLSRISRANDWHDRRSHANATPSQVYSAEALTARWDVLKPGDREALLTGRERIQTFILDVWAPCLISRCEEACLDPHRQCQRNMHVITSLHHSSDDTSTQMDPLLVLRRRFNRSVQEIRNEYSICESCASQAREISLQAKHRLWELLPYFFGLEDDITKQIIQEQAPPYLYDSPDPFFAALDMGNEGYGFSEQDFLTSPGSLASDAGSDFLS